MIISFIIISLLGAISTHTLSWKFSQGVIRSSSLMSLLFGVMLMHLNQYFLIDIDFWLKVFFGASFVGMCSEKWSLSQITAASLFYALCFEFLFPILPHTAGALGLCAFIGVICSQIIFRVKDSLQSS